jgi:hypothetical protein
VRERAKVVLVVASVREPQLRDFLAAWRLEDGFPWDETIVVQDGGGPAFAPAARGAEGWEGVVRYGWEDIAAGVRRRASRLAFAARIRHIKAWGLFKAVVEHGAGVV